MSSRKRQNLEYKIKVATTTGVLDLSNPKDKTSFRFDFECIPDDAVERFRKKEEEKEGAEIFTTSAFDSRRFLCAHGSMCKRRLGSDGSERNIDASGSS